MKLVAIVPPNDGNASTWWRIHQPFRALSVQHRTRIYTYEEVDKADFDGAIVILHRLISYDARDYVRFIRDKGAKAVLYSLDDYTTNKDALEEYLIASGAMSSMSIKVVMDNIAAQIKTIQACDGLICSTFDLANLVYDDVEVRADVVPNGIPLDFWYEALDLNTPYQNQDDYVYIGWAGGRRPEADLEPMAKAWGRIARERNDVKFVVGGWQADVIDRNIEDYLDRRISLKWASLTEWPKSMQVDIGCCALVNTLFNLGKSPIKYFEYTASGAACIFSTPIYTTVAADCLNGRVADTEDEWYEALNNLVNSKALRKQFRQAASYDVMNYYSLEATLIDWNVVLNEYDTNARIQGMLSARG